MKQSSSGGARFFFWVIFLIGVMARVWQLGNIPGGVNQDEALAGYNAYSLLQYGIDNWGYTFPVYFQGGGGGMSVLNSYLMIPFIAIGGLNTLTIRMPQMIVACVSLVMFYLLFKRLFSGKLALLALFVFAICPWHIMMARWGIDCNIAPGFLLFGLYFFVRGIDNSKFYIPSALFYGLSLYSYVAVWIVLPIVLLLQVIYLSRVKKLHIDIYTGLAVLLLAIIASPLILFVLINLGYVQEIRLPYFSIPKMLVWRAGEFSLTDMFGNFLRFCQVVFLQDDGLIWNVTPIYGLYYKWTLPFIAIGLADSIKRTVRSIRMRIFDGLVLFVILFFASLFLGIIERVNVSRIVVVHISVLAILVNGLNCGMRWAKQRWKWFPNAVMCLFIISFIFFEFSYFTDINRKISSDFQEGLGEAVDYALSIADATDTVYIMPGNMWRKILFYSELSAIEYIDTLQWEYNESGGITYISAGPFVFGTDEIARGKDKVYVIRAFEDAQYKEKGFEIRYFDYAAVAY